jgi:hypothetical protein
VKNVAIVLVLVLSAATGFSQCRGNRPTARHEMHAASAVIVGTVTAAEPVAEAWDFLDGISYTVRVDSVLHGKAHRDQFKVFSENSPEFFGMTVGKSYVLYLTPHYDRYEINNCGNSRQLEDLVASTRQLARGD